MFIIKFCNQWRWYTIKINRWKFIDLLIRIIEFLIDYKVDLDNFILINKWKNSIGQEL